MLLQNLLVILFTSCVCCGVAAQEKLKVIDKELTIEEIMRIKGMQFKRYELENLKNKKRLLIEEVVFSDNEVLLKRKDSSWYVNVDRDKDKVDVLIVLDDQTAHIIVGSWHLALDAKKWGATRHFRHDGAMNVFNHEMCVQGVGCEYKLVTHEEGYSVVPTGNHHGFKMSLAE